MLKFYTAPKLFIPPQNKCLATPLKMPSSSIAYPRMCNGAGYLGTVMGGQATVLALGFTLSRSPISFTPSLSLLSSSSFPFASLPLPLSPLRALILFIQTLTLYRLFTYLLTYLLLPPLRSVCRKPSTDCFANHCECSVVFLTLFIHNTTPALY